MNVKIFLKLYYIIESGILLKIDKN